MALQLEPVRIVECPPGNSTSPRECFRGPGDRRPTGRTKFRFYPAVTFVRAVFIGLEYAAYDFDVFLVKIRRHPKGAPDPALARRTMAHPCHVRIPCDSITDYSTKTTTFMYFRHFGAPVLSVSADPNNSHSRSFAAFCKSPARLRLRRPLW